MRDLHNPAFELQSDVEPGSAVVATIGVFDGVHRGHREILATVVERAKERGLTSVAISFDPHPVTVLAPDAPPSRISSRPVQSRLLESSGVDRVWYLPFSRAMADLPPGEFVDYLRARLRLEELWVGYDFRFGRDRAGDLSFLIAEGERHRFEARRFDAVLEGERILSSSWVRDALREGRIGEANGVLGSPFELEGDVVHGLGIGGKELVPTANLSLPLDQLLPARGIYAAWSRTFSEGVAESDSGRKYEAWPTVVSLGTRPTVLADGGDLVEAHRLDWSGDLYGSRLRVRFAAKLRDQKKFGGMDELRDAIGEDLREARSWLYLHPESTGSDWVPKSN